MRVKCSEETTIDHIDHEQCALRMLWWFLPSRRPPSNHVTSVINKMVEILMKRVLDKGRLESYGLNGELAPRRLLQIQHKAELSELHFFTFATLAAAGGFSMPPSQWQSSRKSYFADHNLLMKVNVCHRWRYKFRMQMKSSKWMRVCDYAGRKW